MNAWRQLLPLIAIGSLFILFASWLHVRARWERWRDPDQFIKPTISWSPSLSSSGHDYAIYQFDEGANTPEGLLPPFPLSSSGYEVLCDTGPLGRHGTVYYMWREGGARHTFTSIYIARHGFSIPFGLDRLIALVGIFLIFSGFLVRRHQLKRKTIRPNKSR